MNVSALIQKVWNLCHTQSDNVVGHDAGIGLENWDLKVFPATESEKPR